MSKEIVKPEIKVNESKISIIRIGTKEYISLTDLARYADEDDPRYPIQNWMRNKDVIAYLGLWEKLNNEDFKGVEFDAFKNEAGSNKFKISPQKWIKETNNGQHAQHKHNPPTLDSHIKHIHFGRIHLCQDRIGGGQRVGHIHSPLE